MVSLELLVKLLILLEKQAALAVGSTPSNALQSVIKVGFVS